MRISPVENCWLYMWCQ